MIYSSEYLELIKQTKTKFAYFESLLVLDNGITLGRKSIEGEVFSFDFNTEEVSELMVTQGYKIENWSKIDWDTVLIICY